MIGQYTDQWYRDRAGRFTASPISVLMGKSLSNQTAQDYITRKAIEKFDGFHYPDDLTTYAMQRGTDLEPFALDAFEKVTGKELIRDVYKVRDDLNLVASPDAVLRGADRLLENKCPVDLYKHRLNGLVIKSAADLKKHNKTYYWQVQAQLLAYGFDYGYFQSYHPDAHDYGLPTIYVASIEAVEADQSLLVERLEQATEQQTKLIESWQQ